MDYFIMGICGMEIITIIINDCIKSNVRHYKLQKTKEFIKKESNISKIIKPKYLQLNKKDNFVKLENELKSENIYNFYQVLSHNINKNNLYNFYNNVQSLKIYKKQKNPIIMLIKGDSTLGRYIIPENKIILYRDKEKVLTHELLHMSSTPLNYGAVGFRRVFSNYYLTKHKELDIKHNEIGNGINEGYTEILNNRLFKNRSMSYMFLQKISLLIENFYENKEDIKDSYFNGDINGVIYELSKYMNFDEIIDLIIDIDELDNANILNIIKYFKIKKRLLEIYKKNKSPEEVKKFRKVYKSNHIVQVLRKQI